MNESCDRHSSAKAKARVILPSGRMLYVCGHCSQTLDFGNEFIIEYDTATV